MIALEVFDKIDVKSQVILLFLLSPITDPTSGLFHSSLVTDKVRKGRRGDQPGWGRSGELSILLDLKTLLETRLIRVPCLLSGSHGIQYSFRQDIFVNTNFFT